MDETPIISFTYFTRADADTEVDDSWFLRTFKDGEEVLAEMRRKLADREHLDG